jgi:hypothetical protein
VCGSIRPKTRDFWKMMAHEKTERISRMHKTMRATQPVCVIRLPSGLTAKDNARTEIVSPNEKS